MVFCTISVLPLACMHNGALFCYVNIIPAQFLHSVWRMGRSHVVSSCSVFSVLIIILYAELYIYLMSITIQTFLRDSFFKIGNFFAVFFFTLCIIFFMGEVTLESRSLGQLLTILRARQSLTSIVASTTCNNSQNPKDSNLHYAGPSIFRTNTAFSLNDTVWIKLRTIIQIKTILTRVVV